jgi:hypothetical protein
MLKKKLTPDEKVGLSDDEARQAERYLKKFRTKSIINEMEALPMMQLYMIGTSFTDIHNQYPDYPLPRILLTAALKKWGLNRSKLMGSLKDRVQAKVVKTLVDSVDFTSMLLQVAVTEHLEEMRAYIQDPKNNPLPSLRIQSMKDFDSVLGSLQKLMNTANPEAKGKSGAPNLLTSLEQPKSLAPKETKAPKPKAAAAMLAEIVADSEPTEE